MRFSIKITEIQENLANLFVKKCDFIYNKNMKRYLMILLSFIFLGGAVSGSAFYINSSLSTIETSGGGSLQSEIIDTEDEVTANAPTNSGYWTDSGNYVTSFAGGTGIESDPYLISTPQQLAYLSVLINDSSTNSQYASLYYKQTANLDMSAYWWDAIGDYTSSSNYNAFSGYYDGGNCTISGLYTQSGSSSTYSYQGLFGYVRGTSSDNRATICNVNIQNSEIQGYQYVGGIAGNAYYCDIYNCNNSGSVEGSIYVGGIAGRTSSSSIYDCFNVGSIISTFAGMSYAGGIVGYSFIEVFNCYNEGSVSSGGEYVGGIAGWNDGSIYNCYNKGEVVGDYYIGGILGRGMGNVYNCFNSGAVQGNNGAGIAGWNSAQTIRNCINYGEITGGSSLGGIVGYNGFMSGQTGYVYNCVNLGYVRGDSEGGLVGFNTPSGYVYNSYWGGDCTLSYGYNTSTGTFNNNSKCSTSNAKSQSWYTNSSNWNSSYPWDFETVWTFVDGMNDGYPVLQAFIPGPDNDGYWTDAGNYATSFAGGTGIESDPYLISTPQQLARLAYLINGSSSSTYRSLYYEQTTNLNMSAYWWDAIGYSSSYYFGGKYNGGGFTIAGLYTEAGTTSSYSYQGLFGYIEGTTSNFAEIHDVGIIDSNIQGYKYIGGIAGNTSSSTITNCYNTGSVTGSIYVGGIAGSASSTITNCYWGGNCTLSVAVGSGSATNCGTCTIEEVKSLSWYSDSSKWNSSYPWDFETVWVFMSGENDGYPVLRAFYMVSITFDANGGQGVMDDFKVSIGTSGILPTCTFIRTGYEFAGWATSSTGVVVYADGASITPSASMTLYAVWRVEVYTITLDWQGGSGNGWEVIYYKYGGYMLFDSEACSTGISGSALLARKTRPGYSFSSFTTNADGSGTVMFQNSEYLNLNTIVADDTWYAQWTPNVVAKYDSAGDYWYVENGKMPQTRVTDSGIISALNSTQASNTSYYIAGDELPVYMYNGTEYCTWNGNWYEVEPIRWRLTKDSNQTNGYGTTTDINAVLAEIVFVGQYSSTYLGSGAGYSTTAVEEFKKNGIDEKYLVDYQNEAYNFGNGTTMYNLYKDYTNIFVASESEIKSVSTTTAIEFSDLAKDIIKSYGGTNVYFTRDLGSNYNNITCFNKVGKDTQRFATDYRGVQFTIRFTEYACVN